jgi:hypothetical protein
MESPLKYRPYPFENLIENSLDQGSKQCLVGSLTGVVASQKVTEAFKGSLKTNRNRRLSAKAEGSLTVRHTGRADAKAGLSDPVVLNGRAIAKRIKGTPGITG